MANYEKWPKVNQKIVLSTLLVLTALSGLAHVFARSSNIVLTGARGISVTFVFERKLYNATISSNCQNSASRNIGRSLPITWSGVFPSGGGADVVIEQRSCHLYSIR